MSALSISGWFIVQMNKMSKGEVHTYMCVCGGVLYYTEWVRETRVLSRVNERTFDIWLVHTNAQVSNTRNREK